jgi:bifunctional enzyme CysN/CysC
VAFDPFSANPRVGRFVLVDGYDIVGGGVIAEGIQKQAKSANIFAVDHQVTAASRAGANGHEGGVVWLTGLSGAGKSTIAMEVERRLFLKGWQVTVLDGDNVRHGLCSDLGFSPEDRTENIRRVGEVAHLFAAAGMLVVTAFISPYRADRDRVRAMGKGFHEIHVATGLDECERRDPKGLYKKARAGAIPEFTGISAPYEAPVDPELVLDTAGKSIDQSVEELVAYIEKSFSLTARKRA